ncbi:Uncharacterised protein [Mycobacteroides abscessus subsp. abscessus]|nr:Uncharacterised protein [Mycobacteroides abscessus subsp. abscessus]
MTKGAIGAINWVSVTSVECSVDRAPASPSQKRRRLRRTYQFDRLSMNSPSRCPVVWVSKSSRAAVTSATNCWVDDASQRSRTWLGAVRSAGVQSLARAYSAWKLTVFQ